MEYYIAKEIKGVGKEMSSLKKNIGYQTAYQLLNTVLPLITSPYLARVLGASQLGVFSYTQSIVGYFVLFATLGVTNYGTRTIASCKDDKTELSRNFFEIYLFQIITSLIAITFYGAYIVIICDENIIIALLQGLLIIGSLMDINWLFFGIENFKVTVTRNMFVRMITVMAILLLVKSPDDLWLYTLIMSSGTVLSNAVLFYFVPKVVNVQFLKQVSFEGIIKHIKPNIVLFIPLLAMSVYHIMDKTMLGILSTYEQTGFYYNADKVINIPIGIISGIGTVMLPRATSMIENGKIKEYKQLFNITVEMIVIVSSAMAFGIAAIANEFTPFFFGKGYEECILLIIVLSPVLIIKALSQTSRMQYLIPNHKEKIFIQSVFVGAIANLTINWYLIPQIGALGAVIGTLIAELITCLWQYIKMNQYIQCGKILVKSSVYLVFGSMMFFGIRALAHFITKIIPSLFISVAIEIIAGVMIYIFLNLIYSALTKNFIWMMVMNKFKTDKSL